jgi:hypothetical protein
VPHASCYGSVHATPLYLRLFAEACRWSGWLITDDRDGVRSNGFGGWRGDVDSRSP